MSKAYNPSNSKALAVELNSGRLSLRESLDLISFFKSNAKACLENLVATKEDVTEEEFEGFIGQQAISLLKDAIKQRDEEIALALLRSNLSLEVQTINDVKEFRSIFDYLSEEEKEYYAALSERCQQESSSDDEVLTPESDKQRIGGSFQSMPNAKLKPSSAFPQLHPGPHSPQI